MGETFTKLREARVGGVKIAWRPVRPKSHGELVQITRLGLYCRKGNLYKFNVLGSQGKWCSNEPSCIKSGQYLTGGICP